MAWLGSALLQHPAGHGDGALEDNPMAGEPTEKSVRARVGGALAQPPLPHVHSPLKILNFACRAILEGPKARLWS